MQKISEYGNFEIDGQLYDKDDVMNLIYLQSELLLKEGLLCSIEECESIWSGYSNDLHASWLCFPENVEDYLPTIKNNDYFISFENYIGTYQVTAFGKKIRVK